MRKNAPNWEKKVTSGGSDAACMEWMMGRVSLQGLRGPMRLDQTGLTAVDCSVLITEPLDIPSGPTPTNERTNQPQLAYVTLSQSSSITGGGDVSLMLIIGG